MGFDSVSDFLHQWIDQDKITVIRDNPHYDLVEEINKLRTDKFNLEKIETQFNLQNEKFQLMGFDDANDFLDQWLEDHKIEIVIDPDTVSHNNVNKYKAENFELKNKCNKLEKDIERLENQFNIQNYNKSVTSLNIKLKEEIKNLKAENVDLLSQINNLKKKNKQLCKDADTFLKKKDPASKMYQDLEFIKNLINTLQKEYNKSESKNGIID
jgi:predicted RNase H-like nuclease (RuvC/YqgF family)